MQSKERGFGWENTLSEDQLRLYDRMIAFGGLFDDMLLRKGSGAYELLKVSHKGPDGEWTSGALELPYHLEYFDYENFDAIIEKLDECRGYFRGADQVLAIDEASQDDDSVLLHEMIHLHEYALTDGIYPVYADAVLWSLYRSLRDQIPALDDIITDQMHILNSSEINEAGGAHDLLFMLKSFDLDLRMGYPLGTVYGYGMREAISGEDAAI